MKQVSVIWSKMPAPEKQVFHDLSHKDRERYEEEREIFLRNRDSNNNTEG